MFVFGLCWIKRNLDTLDGKMVGIIHNFAIKQNKQLQSLLIFLKIEIALGLPIHTIYVI